MAKTTIPRGVQTVTRTNADKTKSIRYRVRINRDGIKSNKYFDDLKEAVNYLAYSKTDEGKLAIPKFTEEQLKRQEELGRLLSEPVFSFYVDEYYKRYIQTKEQLTFNQKRNVKNTLSFLTTIKNTEIELQPQTDLGGIFALGGFHSNQKKKLGAFHLRDITSIVINEYIRSRLKTVKKISVHRELTHISRVFQKLKYIDKNLITVQNPILEYDKDLLINRDHKRQYILSDEEEQELIGKLQKYKNPQMFHICLISLWTGMRRSEVVTLQRHQVNVNDGYIQLWHTKSNQPRKVHLTDQARELFTEILAIRSQEKLFDYTILGFDGSFTKWKDENGFKHMRFHDLRRTFISKFVMRAGAENSTLIAELLGFSSSRKFDENFVKPLAPKPDELKKSVGHSGEIHKRYIVIRKN